MVAATVFEGGTGGGGGGGGVSIFGGDVSGGWRSWGGVLAGKMSFGRTKLQSRAKFMGECQNIEQIA